MNNFIGNSELTSLHLYLTNHSMYKKINSFKNLKIMMESHVFAVWDFMSLLKRLQKDITCVDIPWRPSPYPKKLVRLINEIVLGEESDLDRQGIASDHFTLYLKAMDEVGASTKRIETFLINLELEGLSNAERLFVEFNLNLALHGDIHEVAAAFFFGREKLIPDMFTSILIDLENNLEQNEQSSYPNLKYYLERHVEIDGGEHSHLAQDCLEILCGNDVNKWNKAYAAGIKSLQLRADLWNEVECNF